MSGHRQHAAFYRIVRLTCWEEQPSGTATHKLTYHRNPKVVAMRAAIGTLLIILCGTVAFAQAPPLEDTLPLQEGSAKISIPLKTEDADLRSFLSAPAQLFLTVEVKGQCALVYAKHEHQAYVTQGRGGPRQPIRRIDLHSNIAGDRQTKTCENTEFCGRTEEEYNIGCRRSCVSATGTLQTGQKWFVNEACIW